MKAAQKLVACLCSFGTLLVGCYSSQVIDPGGSDKGKLSSGSIVSLVTNDSTMYEFREPPAIVRDSVVGLVEERVPAGVKVTRVSVPLSDVAYVVADVQQPAPVFLLPALIGIILLMALIGSAKSINVGWTL